MTGLLSRTFCVGDRGLSTVLDSDSWCNNNYERNLKHPLIQFP